MAGTPQASARTAGPPPAVTALLRVKAAKPLSSQTNSTGRRYSAAQFIPSRKGPRFTAPSPKKHATIASCFVRRIACAAPQAIGMPAPTTPFAPSIPTAKSAMCIDPPLPPQDPPARPCSSSIIARASAPFAMAWPWPRCVLVIRSARFRFAQTPTATPS